MAPFARKTLISRRSWLIAGLSTPVFFVRGEGRPGVLFDGDNLHVAAPPNWHFLTGKPLQRLKDGATVVYLAQMGLFDDGTFQRPIQLAPVDRFAISYDVWQEDRFSVTMVTPLQRTVESRSAPAAEQWCLENLAISASNLAADRRFWLRMEMRTADQKDLAGLVAGPGISLAEIVVRLGKKAGADDPKYSLWAGPLRLQDLVRTPGRGPRNG
jgi:hypothetical protein